VPIIILKVLSTHGLGRNARMFSVRIMKIVKLVISQLDNVITANKDSFSNLMENVNIHVTQMN